MPFFNPEQDEGLAGNYGLTTNEFYQALADRERQQAPQFVAPMPQEIQQEQAPFLAQAGLGMLPQAGSAAGLGISGGNPLASAAGGMLGRLAAGAIGGAIAPDPIQPGSPAATLQQGLGSPGANIRQGLPAPTQDEKRKLLGMAAPALGPIGSGIAGPVGYFGGALLGAKLKF